MNGIDVGEDLLGGAPLLHTERVEDDDPEVHDGERDEGAEVDHPVSAAPRVALDPFAPWHLPDDCLQSAETPWRDDPAASGAAVS